MQTIEIPIQSSSPYYDSYTIIESDNSEFWKLLLFILPHPEWYKENLKLPLRSYMEKYQGHWIFVVNKINNNEENKIGELLLNSIRNANDYKNIDLDYLGIKILGSIFIELQPPHLSKNERIPIFGWLNAKDQNICALLLKSAEHYVLDNGYSIIRGPINHPKMYGGWGAYLWSEDTPYFLESSVNSKELNNWFESSSYERTTEYVFIQDTSQIHPDGTFEDIHFERVKFKELLENNDLLFEIQSFIGKYFTGILPDRSDGTDTIEEIFRIYGQIDNPEDYYLFARDQENKLVALIIGIPNIIESWAGEKIHTVVVDTAVVARKYWGKELFHVMYNLFYNHLKSRGINRVLASLVWKQNQKALKSFLKAGKIVAEYAVYQKKII